MRIDAIVADMDDTLFDGQGKLSAETLRVLRACTNRGIRVIPASGRTQPSMAPYMKQLNTGCPYIGCNGAELLSERGELLELDTLDGEAAREICRYLKAQGFYVQVYRGDHYYYDAACDPSMRYKQASGLGGVAVDDLTAFLDFPVSKLLSINHPWKVEELLPVIRERFHTQATFTVSKPYFIEVIPPMTSKGNALCKLAARLKLSPERTMVFGDSLNDISMLQCTENSVAMGNARPEVKRVARYVCGPNTQDGLARFVEAHVLRGEPMPEKEAEL